MNAHARKQRALEAYLTGNLSPEGSRRLEAHLASCADCRETREVMERYRTTTQDVRDVPLPDVNWDRIEAALQDAPQPRASSGRSRWLWPALAVAAAALIGVLQQRPTETPAPPSPAVTGPAEPTQPQAPPAPAEVTLAANDVQVADAPAGSPGAPLDTTHPLREGRWLRTGKDSSLHLRLGEGTGIALAPESAVKLARLREGQTRLWLARGAVDSKVAPLGEGQHFEVEAAAYLVRVRGTHFRVAVTDGVAAVRVEEGRVEVLKGAHVVATVEAGGEWRAPEAPLPAAPQAPEDAAPLIAPVGLSAAQGEAWLRVPATPNVQAWLPLGDEAPIVAGDELRMRLPPGPGTLHVLDRQGQLKEVTFELSPEGTELTERELRHQLAPPPPRFGTLEVAQIMPVLQRGMGGLRSCYERALRGGQSGGAALELNVRVAPTGTVDQVRVTGEGLDAGLVRCVRTRVGQWRFPPPEGGPAHLQLPVNLRPKRP